MQDFPIIRTIIADDHTMVRNGIRSLINNKNNIVIIDDVENGEKLVESYNKFNPEVLLVDIEMPVMSGIKAVEKIWGENKDVKALFLSMYDDEASFYQVIKAGGRGLIGKSSSEGQLISAIMIIKNGGYYFRNTIDREDVEKIIVKYEGTSNQNTSSEVNKLKEMYELLSPKEKELISALSEGLTRTEIAEKLLISKSTYDYHEKNIKVKLGISSTPELIKFAYAFKYSK